MADSKLSALPEVTTLADTDELYINDAGQPKRITKANLEANVSPSAANVSVADSGGNYDGTDVEAVLAEVATDVAAMVNYKNKARNGDFSVNQKTVSGSVVLSADEMGHDGWFGGSSGCTYTFATTANVTTLTISAGSLYQTVDGDALQSGTHVLGWTGTATGQIDSGGYAASGVTATLTGGTNAVIEFSTGTLSNVQIESGDTVTAFERLTPAAQQALCKLYFERIRDKQYIAVGVARMSSTTRGAVGFAFSPKKSNTPTVEISAAADFALNNGAYYVVSTFHGYTACREYALLDMTAATLSGSSPGDAVNIDVYTANGYIDIIDEP